LTPQQEADQAVSALTELPANVSGGVADEARQLYHAAGGAQADIADVVGRWTGAGNRIEEVRQEIADGLHAQTLLAAERGPQAPTLWRGLPIRDAEMDAWARHARPGDTIDFAGLSSFTEEQMHAQFFAGDWGRILIELHDARGLPVRAISNTPNEAEWLVTGHAEITRIVSRRVEVDEDGYQNVILVVEARWRA
jgi:hypothetical protein